MEVYFRNNFVSFYYEKQTQLGKAVWRGHLRGPEFREAYLLGLDMVDRFSLNRWLADDRFMDSIDPDDLTWSLQVFVPRLAKSSLLRMARLPSHSEENRESVDMMIEKGQNTGTHIVLRDFTDEQEAVEWLMRPL